MIHVSRLSSLHFAVHVAHARAQIDGVHVVEHTPVFAVTYARMMSGYNVRGGFLPILCMFRALKPGREDSITHFDCSIQELELLHRLLYLNSEKLAESSAQRTSTDRHKPRKSFLVPLQPLSQAQVSGLFDASACEVCSKPAVQRCKSCQNVQYCGTGRWFCTRR